MKKLDPLRIRKGKQRLYIALGILIVANLASLALNLFQNGLDLPKGCCCPGPHW